MKRVLQVVTYMGCAGLETMLMNAYRHIDREKLQFDFLVHRAFEADYDQEILSLGGRIYHMPPLIPWSRSYRKQLKEFLQIHREYEVIHVHQDCFSAVALRCAKECGIPVRIAHSHSSREACDWKYPIRCYYRRQIPRYATHLFACSKMAGNWMFGERTYQVVRNAIDAEAYRYDALIRQKIRKQWNLEDALVIGHVGRFSKVKNHRFLLKVFRECLTQNGKAKLLLVGDGSEKEQMCRLARKLGIEKQVLFVGVRKDIPKLLQVMDVFVFPSRHEGLAIAVVEAQAAGLPCVISKEMPEECVVTGNLVTALDLEMSPEKWAKVILEKARMQRTDRSVEIKKAGYDIKREAEKLQEFYLSGGTIAG